MENKGKQFKGNGIKKYIKEDWEDDLGEEREDVVEYIISFEPGELYDEYGGEFITDDKGEADDLFDDLKEEHKLDQVSQYIEKTWEWDKVNEEYYEGDVDVYFYAGDELEFYGESKKTEGYSLGDDKESFDIYKHTADFLNKVGKALEDLGWKFNKEKSKFEKEEITIDMEALQDNVDELYIGSNKLKLSKLADAFSSYEDIGEDTGIIYYVSAKAGDYEARQLASKINSCEKLEENREVKTESLGDRYEVWQSYYEDGRTTTEYVMSFDNYAEAQRFASGLMQDPDCDAWVEDREAEESKKVEDRKIEAKQVNNMKIKYNKIYDKYDVITPDGRALEEFDTEEEAIEWAKEQKDFIKKREEDLIRANESKKITEGIDDDMIIEDTPAEELFNALNSAETFSVEEWNRASDEERIAMVKPILLKFYENNKEKINDNWEDFMDLLEYYNWHTECRILRDLVNGVLTESIIDSKNKVIESKLIVTNIKWDTDGEDIDLPKEMEVELPEYIDETDEDEVDEYVSDYISDETGFCHYGFDIKEVKTEAVMTSNKVSVYQIQETANCSYLFMGYDFAVENGGPDMNDYEKVAEVEIDTRDTDVTYVLDEVFTYGNTNIEYYDDNPKARSISVSDILEYNGNKYYVDSFGFKKLEDTENKQVKTEDKQDNGISLSEAENKCKEVEKLLAEKLPDYNWLVNISAGQIIISDLNSKSDFRYTKKNGWGKSQKQVEDIVSQVFGTTATLDFYDSDVWAKHKAIVKGINILLPTNESEEKVDYSKFTPTNKVLSGNKGLSEDKIDEMRWALPDLFKNMTDEQKQIFEELSLREMVMSCLVYGDDIHTAENNVSLGKYRGKPYVAEYYDTLGKDVTEKIIKQQTDYFNRGKVIKDVGTDSEGVTYNSFEEPEEESKKVTEAKPEEADKEIWEKVEKIVDTADNEIGPDQSNEYEYDEHIKFVIYRDFEFEDIFEVYTYLDGEAQGELDTGDVHLEDLDATMVDIVKKLQSKENLTETKYGDSNPDKIVPDAYCEIEKTDNGYYINCGIGTHTSLGGGNFTIYPEDYLSNLHKEVKKLAKERGIKRVYDKVKTIIPEYNAMIPEYNANIENMIKDLTPFAEKSKQGQLTRADLDSIEEITGKITPNRMSTLPEFEWSGKFGRLRSLLGNLERYKTDLSNPLASADTITITESKEVKTEAVRYVIYKNEEPTSPYKNPEGGYTQYSDIDEAIADAKEIDADYIEKLIYKNEDEADREELADTVSVVWKSKKTEATLNKFQTMTTDKNGNEMLLKDVSYNNACSWLEKELAKAGSKVVDTETKGNKTIIKADNKTNFEYDEEKGTLKRLEEAEDMTQVKNAIETAVEKSDSTDLEKEQVKGSLDVLKTDEESAIEGYEDFKSETEKVADEELADAVNNQMEEIIDDEKEHIEKLDTIKSALGENKKTEAICPEAVKEKVEKAKADIGLKKAEEMIDTEKELTEGIKKEIIQYAKQQGLDVEKLQKQGQLDSVAEALDNIIGEMVSKTAVEYMDTTGKDIEWDFDISNNDIQVIIQ